MSGTKETPSIPRAMIHKRILDVAQANPEASVDDLVSLVSGATPGLVRRVFDEYRDPRAVKDEPAQPTVEEPMSRSDTPIDAGAESTANYDSSSDSPPDPAQSVDVIQDIEKHQLDTLEAIHEHPDASQRQLAEVMGVSHSTISHRLNEIDGFDWENRWAFVTDFFEADAGTDPVGGDAEFVDRLKRIERRLEELAGTGTGGLDDPQLVHKVVHACMQSENISEDEELRILKTAMLGCEE